MYKNFTQFFCTPPGCKHKILLIMKLTTVLLIGTFLQVSAASLAQNITYSHKSVSLEQLFKVIRKQTGYNVLWSSDKLKNMPVQDVDFKDVPVGQVLDKVLSGKPLTYQIDNKTILIKERQISTPAPLSEKPTATLIDVHGQVVNESGEPLAGATVKNKNTNKGTITDAKGYFTLKSSDNNAILTISYIGYQNFETKAAQELGVVPLKIATNQLDAVQVIAYGQTTKRLTVGNIASVSAKEIEEQPVANPLLALQGRVSGMFITQNSGVSGGGVTVRVQGQNSIANGSDPLYIIDGVPFYSQFPTTSLDAVLGPGANGGLNQAPGASASPFNYLSPGDIESIEVLKDASATAIYGSRAANGAVLITTKKGKSGKTKFDLNIQDGVGQVSHFLPVLNTSQYLEMRNEALKNDGLTAQPTDYDLTVWDKNKYTNWQNTFLGNASNYLNTSANISGGSPNIQYLIGATYHRETSVFPLPSDFADQKGAFHVSLTNTSTDNKFKLQFTGNYMYDNNKLPSNDLTTAAVELAPNAPSLFNPDGSLNWEPSPAGLSTFINPLTELYNTYDNKTSNLISNLQLSYKLLPGLDISSNFGYTNTQTNEFLQRPLIGMRPEFRTIIENSALYGSRNLSSWIIEPQASFKRNFGSGTLDVLIGGTLSRQNASGSTITGQGYSSDEVLQNMAAASTLSSSPIESQYRYMGVFSRINFNLKDEFIIDLTARSDGSSRFGPANEFHDFGSLGGAWIFSKENIVEKELRFLSFGKLRASYGTTGNDQIGDYNFLSLYAPNPSYFGPAYQGITGFFPYQLSNPYLEWEVTRKMQLGIDLGFFKDRILFNGSFSQNRSSNQLLPYKIPSITGFTTIFENFPATVQNTSWEFTVSSENIKGKNFRWKTSFNLTIPDNKLLSFPDLANSSFANTLVIGQPLSIIKTPHLIGVDPTTGQYKFQSKTDPFNPLFPDDLNTLVNTLPKLYGGVENSITYKNFQLDFLFQFVKQIGPNLRFGFPNNYIIPGSFTKASSNQPLGVLMRWKSPGENEPVAAYSTQIGNENLLIASLSDASYSDASYIRLKNLSLSWRLPEQWTKAHYLENLRIFVQGQNLLTFTKYKGLDPENMSISALPPLRVITLGLEIGL